MSLIDDEVFPKQGELLRHKGKTYRVCRTNDQDQIELIRVKQRENPYTARVISGAEALKILKESEKDDMDQR